MVCKLHMPSVEKTVSYLAGICLGPKHPKNAE